MGGVKCFEAVNFEVGFIQWKIFKNLFTVRLCWIHFCGNIAVSSDETQLRIILARIDLF